MYYYYIKSQNLKSVKPYLEFTVTVLQKTFTSQDLDSVSMKPSLAFTALAENVQITALRFCFYETQPRDRVHCGYLAEKHSNHSAGLNSVAMKPSLELVHSGYLAKICFKPQHLDSTFVKPSLEFTVVIMQKTFKSRGCL